MNKIQDTLIRTSGHEINITTLDENYDISFKGAFDLDTACSFRDELSEAILDVEMYIFAAENPEDIFINDSILPLVNIPINRFIRLKGDDREVKMSPMLTLCYIPNMTIGYNYKFKLDSVSHNSVEFIEKYRLMVARILEIAIEEYDQDIDPDIIDILRSGDFEIEEIINVENPN